MTLSRTVSTFIRGNQGLGDLNEDLEDLVLVREVEHAAFAEHRRLSGERGSLLEAETFVEFRERADERGRRILLSGRAGVRRDRGVVAHAQRERSDGNLVAVLDDRLRQRLSVHPNAVCRTVVLEHPIVFFLDDDRVLSRDGKIVEHDVVFRRSPDRHFFFQKGVDLGPAVHFVEELGSLRRFYPESLARLDLGAARSPPSGCPWSLQTVLTRAKGVPLQRAGGKVSGAGPSVRHRSGGRAPNPDPKARAERPTPAAETGSAPVFIDAIGPRDPSRAGTSTARPPARRRRSFPSAPRA